MADEPTNAIEVHKLVKRYGEKTAVDGLDLSIRRGELLCLLGPNGAGKSTTLRMLTTLMPPTEGQIVIAGYRVPEENEKVKPLLGLVPQEIALYDMLTARQNLRFFGEVYGFTGNRLHERVATLLEAVQLTDRADDVVRRYSGGMQRRVNIAAALIHDPAILFMDEPTVGLDPISRNAIWKIIEDMKARGKTVVLTTHYMEEAEALCDRVAIVDHGKLIALGAPAELIRATGVQTLVSLTVTGDMTAHLGSLRQLPEVKDVRVVDGRLEVQTPSGSRLLPQLIEQLLNKGVEVRSAEVTAPNLGSVFLHYTGRELRD